jgi:sulfite exporter TauE/SafE
MLSSITPLGERSRGSNWVRTVCAYVVGAALSATMVGLILGAIGKALGLGGSTSPFLALILGVCCLVGIVLDSGVRGMRVPTTSRQVNRLWMERYRDWVYGIGYGVQLGVGFATIVTASSIYLVFLSELLTGSALAGATIGLVFGLVRSMSILMAFDVKSTGSLVSFHARLESAYVRTKSRLLRAQGVVGGLGIATWLAVRAAR